MTISEQIKVLCVRLNVSNAELARRLNMSPQAFSGRMKRESFTVADIESIAEALGVEYRHFFVLESGEEV